jgi:hypothetical protein
MRTGRATLIVAVIVAIMAMVSTGGCRRSLEGGIDASGHVVPTDALVRDASPAEVITIDTGIAFDRFLPEGIPKADPDAGECLPPYGEDPAIVCFGSDPLPYQKYLQPVDGGPAPGQCPTARDFNSPGGERCGWVSCGPLLGSAVPDPADAAATAGDAGTDCCFYVARACGVGVASSPAR